MTRNIDELSNLKTKSEPPEQYFKKMDLDEEQVERRIEYTEKANELFDVILILLLTMQENGSVDYAYARTLLESWLLSLIAEFTTPDDYLIDYAADTAYNFVETTKNHEGEPWYTSQDRSLYNAENSANDVLNYDEYKRAIEAGKTHKKWITENDRKVRDSHRELHNKVIPIKEYFRVGVARMRFPKDYEYASMFPEELVNCRCSIQYLPKDNDPMEKKTTTSWKSEPTYHTPEEIEELQKYGFDKGVNVTNSFTYFDGDISLIKDFIDTFSEHINKRVPHKLKDKVYLDVSYSMEDTDYATAKNATVTLNGYAYRDRELLKRDYAENEKIKFFSSNSTYKDIATHEAGHVITFLNQLKYKKIVENLFSANWNDAEEMIKQHISEYATQSAKELLAESYVAYSNGSQDEYVLKVMEYCGIL